MRYNIYAISAGGHLTVRSNWKIYCEEFMTATRSSISTGFLPQIDTSVGVQRYLPKNEPLTHFEAKYAAAAVPLYQVELDLGQKKVFTGSSLILSDSL
jgi:hypothetical protein